MKATLQIKQGAPTAAIAITALVLLLLHLQAFVAGGFTLRAQRMAEDDVSSLTLVHAAGSGNLFNQVFWLVVLAAITPLLWRDRGRLARRALDQAPLLALLAFALLSALWAVDLEIALRRWARLTLTLVVLIGLVALLRRERHFLRAAEIAALGLVLVNLWALASAFEMAWPEDGLLLGAHHNKNVAGQAAAFTALIFAFAAAQSADPRGTALRGSLALLALAALWLTGSRTALLAAAGGLLFGFGLAFAAKRGPMALGFAYFLLAAGLALLMALIDLGLADRLFVRIEGARLVEDATMSGRTEIWAELARFHQEAPIVGHGYGGVWNAGPDAPQMRGLEQLRIIVQGHNGYLDLLVAMGWVGAIMAAFWLAWPFLRALLSTGRAPSALAFGLIAAALIHNAAESSFLRPGHSMFALLIMAQCLALASARQLVFVRKKRKRRRKVRPLARGNAQRRRRMAQLRAN